ncbi:MAG: right-handed parallel beta-helix repeat-containing protein [Planctomycetota bacterium]|jgi:hypothetical protein
MRSLTLISVCLLLAIPCQAQIIYVDGDAPGANNGQNWADAYNYLQDALTDARLVVKPVEIRVAEGIYTPDSNSADPDGSGDRMATFQLINGVAVRGGYAGSGEPDPNARDIELYETILSGDLNSNDGPDFANNSENSYHVVTGYQTDSMDKTTDVLDGFLVTGGNANGSSYPNNRGGGMYCNSDTTITNCTFIGNSADWAGGGMFCGPSWCCATCATLTNCTFIGNSAGEEGGGLWVGDNDPTLTNCRIIANSAGKRGGGVMFGNDNFTTMVNCLINGNSADWGGGIYGVFCFRWTMTNCTVSGNLATERGGGMFNEYDCHMTLTNCVLWMNQDSGGLDESAQVDYEPGQAPVVNYSCIQSWTGALGGIGNINEDPCFVDPGFWDVNGTPTDANDDIWIDGDYHLLSSSLCINAGDPNYIPGPNETDMDGDLRVIYGRVDIGADEYSKGCFPPDHPDYARWLAAGEPDCWCYPRQCNGDADGLMGGSSKTGFYYVGPGDLGTLISGWLVTEPPHGIGIASIPNGICADFAHDLGGGGKCPVYHVGPTDLGILIANWLVKEPPFGPGIPPDCLDVP